MIELFNTVLTEPLFNLLVFLYNNIPGNDFGIAIILLTILIKLALLPLSHQAIKGQKALQDLQPKMEVIKKQYKNDKEGQAKAMMELYKAEKVNPLSSCLPLLIQLPFLLAVYQVLIKGFHPESLGLLYSFVQNPGFINHISFGFLDLFSPFYEMTISPHLPFSSCLYTNRSFRHNGSCMTILLLDVAYSGV